MNQLQPSINIYLWVAWLSDHTLLYCTTKRSDKRWHFDFITALNTFCLLHSVPVYLIHSNNSVNVFTHHSQFTSTYFNWSLRYRRRTFAPVLLRCTNQDVSRITSQLGVTSHHEAALASSPIIFEPNRSSDFPLCQAPHTPWVESSVTVMFLPPDWTRDSWASDPSALHSCLSHYHTRWPATTLTSCTTQWAPQMKQTATLRPMSMTGRDAVRVRNPFWSQTNTSIPLP
jgi:hypothetical protein